MLDTESTLTTGPTKSSPIAPVALAPLPSDTPRPAIALIVTVAIPAATAASAVTTLPIKLIVDILFAVPTIALSSRIVIPSIAPAGAEVTHWGAEPEPLEDRIWPAVPVGRIAELLLPAWYNNWLVPLIERSVAVVALPEKPPEAVKIPVTVAPLAFAWTLTAPPNLSEDASIPVNCDPSPLKLLAVIMPVAMTPFAFSVTPEPTTVWPETVSAPNVPTLVNEELTTVEPRVVLLNTVLVPAL